MGTWDDEEKESEMDKLTRQEKSEADCKTETELWEGTLEEANVSLSSNISMLLFEYMCTMFSIYMFHVI